MRSLQEQEAPELLVPVRSEGKPPGWHLKVSTSLKKKSELTAISRPEPVCFVWSWHPPLLRNATLCAPRFASVQTFYAQSGRLGSTTIRSYAKETEKKPGKDLSALLFLLCTVWVKVFLLLLQTSLMSLGVFFLILNYAFQETELSCLQAALLRAQRPLLSAARNRPRRLPKLGSGGHSGAVKWD